jgi:hypothetical protein
VNVFIPLGVALLLIGLFTWFSPLLRHRVARHETTEDSPGHAAR